MGIRDTLQKASGAVDDARSTISTAAILSAAAVIIAAMALIVAVSKR